MAAALPPFVLGAGRYPSLTGIQLLDLTAKLIDNDRVIAWAMAHGLLAGSRVCRRCPTRMDLEDCLEGDGKRWRCQSQRCRSTMSVRADSFFTKSKLPLKDCIMVRNQSLSNCTEFLKYSI